MSLASEIGKYMDYKLPHKHFFTSIKKLYFIKEKNCFKLYNNYGAT